MPVGFGGKGIKNRDRSLAVMGHLEKSIVEVKAENNCLAHALLIALSKLTNDPNYKSYRDGWKIRPVVQLLQATCLDLNNCAGIPKLTIFQEYFHEYTLVVYAGLSCDSIRFEGQVESSKRIHLLYVDITEHYYVITNLTDGTATLRL